MSLLKQVFLVLVLVFLAHLSFCQEKDSLTILNEFKPHRSPSSNTDASYTFFENFVKNPDNVLYYPYFVGMAYEELGLIYSNRGELQKGIALYDSSYGELHSMTHPMSMLPSVMIALVWELH